MMKTVNHGTLIQDWGVPGDDWHKGRKAFTPKQIAKMRRQQSLNSRGPAPKPTLPKLKFLEGDDG